MKTQSEIEVLLSQWYGSTDVQRILMMDEAELWAEHKRLSEYQFSLALDAAMDGVWMLRSVYSNAKPTVRINLTKRPVHA